MAEELEKEEGEQRGIKGKELCEEARERGQQRRRRRKRRSRRSRTVESRKREMTHDKAKNDGGACMKISQPSLTSARKLPLQ